MSLCRYKRVGIDELLDKHKHKILNGDSTHLLKNMFLRKTIQKQWRYKHHYENTQESLLYCGWMIPTT
jgi:hypothetical protein